ncbi:putative mitochondrial protein [Tanacetum coccineum]
MEVTSQPALMMFSIYPNTGLQLMSMKQKVEPALQKVIDSYAKVFENPTKLPPVRTHDHKIPLLPGTPPVNIRPYRHPLVQKDAIKAMLNKHTLKDKFHIPIIEELIDELCGVEIFTKLDLRSGYHQMRMFEDDIAKTTFRTREGHYEFLVMPFGLTNAPFTFQSLMNEVFREFLRKFTLVFFDDILIYIKSLQDHVHHLTAVLTKIKDHSLYAKESKCVFGTTHVDYLGHVISAQGVATDPSKIQVMQTWPVPANLKQLRGFLGLTGNYRRFIKGFASIMLALPNFSKPFIVETDASGVGLGAVLQQEGHPIAYMSKTLAPKHQALSTYEKEFLAVLMALDKWRGYLLDRHFVIKTDHYSLKYLLDQKITTPTQMKWIPKLMGFDYEVVYKKGIDNAAADALSRREDMGAIGGHSGKCKPDLSAYPGLLQPLPIPQTVWSSISIDFMKGLPKSHGCTVILVIVDRLTKYGHFIPLSHPFTALQVAQVFLDQVCKLHGMLESIALDRDKVLKQVDKQRSERAFEVGNWVLLKLQPHRQVSIRQGKQNKFSPKYFGPFQVLAKIGTVAYKLKLPAGSQIHDVFHVSQLKKVHRDHHLQSPAVLPQVNNDGLLEVTPLKILDRKLVKKNNDMVVYGLVQWSNGQPQDTTWELLEEVYKKFPLFDS